MDSVHADCMSCTPAGADPTVPNSSEETAPENGSPALSVFQALRPTRWTFNLREFLTGAGSVTGRQHRECGRAYLPANLEPIPVGSSEPDISDLRPAYWDRLLTSRDSPRAPLG